MPQPRASSLLPDLRLSHAPVGQQVDILSADALAFVAELHRQFEPRRQELLAARAAVRRRIRGGAPPGFQPGKAEIRGGEWTVAPIPPHLQDRRNQITGPVAREMILTPPNSRATVSMD